MIISVLKNYVIIYLLKVYESQYMAHLATSGSTRETRLSNEHAQCGYRQIK